MTHLPDHMRARLAGLALDVPLIDHPSTQFFGEDHAPRQSAVMIPLCAPQGEASVVLTRRALHLSKHPGEYSFPGGSVDPGDGSLLDTALRECEEEVALGRDALDVFGFFASVPTLTDFQIAAFIASFDHRTPMRSDPGEVAHIAITPLRDLLAPDVHRVQLNTYGNLTVPAHSFHLDPAQPIWGATAYLLHELLQCFGLEYA